MGGKSWEPSPPGLEPKRLAVALGVLTACLPSFVPRECPDPAPVLAFPDSQWVPCPLASMPSAEKVSLAALSPLPDVLDPPFMVARHPVFTHLRVSRCTGLCPAPLSPGAGARLRGTAPDPRSASAAGRQRTRTDTRARVPRGHVSARWRLPVPLPPRVHTQCSEKPHRLVGRAGGGRGHRCSVCSWQTRAFTGLGPRQVPKAPALPWLSGNGPRLENRSSQGSVCGDFPELTQS